MNDVIMGRMARCARAMGFCSAVWATGIMSGVGSERDQRTVPLVATLPLVATTLCLAASILLGGGTRSGFLSDAYLQTVAVPLVLIILWAARLQIASATASAFKQDRLAIVLLALVVAVPLLQLLPLPYDFWRRLPGRSEIGGAADLGIPDASGAWRSLSIAPERTWGALLSLAAPVAIFLGTLQLSFRQRRVAVASVVLLSLVSVFVGLLQVAQGQQSSCRFFEITNTDDAVGFFANRNHFAALLYCATAFTAAWLIDTASDLSGARRRGGLDGAPILRFALAFLMFVVLVAGQLFSRSRAGIGLTILALCAIAIMAMVMDKRSRSTSLASKQNGFSTSRIIVGAVGLAALIGVNFSLYRVLGRFEADPLADARITFASTTYAAASAYFPTGVGIGGFVPVFSMFEPVTAAISDIYANRAHNDYLEFWLEAGVPGAVIVVLLAVWAARRIWSVWRHDAGAQTLDASITRSASIAVVLLAVHSLVDYPLRTGALLGLLAFSAALLVPAARTDEPTAPAVEARRRSGRKSAEKARSRQPLPTPQSTARHANFERPGQDGGGLDVHEAWRVATMENGNEGVPRSKHAATAM